MVVGAVTSCAKCQHPIDWHGDRAISGCDGGYDGKELRRFRPYGDFASVSLCNCPGWSDA